jgi:hypothetical protein
MMMKSLCKVGCSRHSSKIYLKRWAFNILHAFHDCPAGEISKDIRLNMILFSSGFKFLDELIQLVHFRSIDNLCTKSSSFWSSTVFDSSDMRVVRIRFSRFIYSDIVSSLRAISFTALGGFESGLTCASSFPKVDEQCLRISDLIAIICFSIISRSDGHNLQNCTSLSVNVWRVCVSRDKEFSSFSEDSIDSFKAHIPEFESDSIRVVSISLSERWMDSSNCLMSASHFSTSWHRMPSRRVFIKAGRANMSPCKLS